MLFALCAVSFAGIAPLAAQDSTTDREAILKAFIDRVNAYVDLTKKLDNGLPRLKPEPATTTVEANEHMLASRIREARKNAKPGDIFGDAAAYFKATIKRDTESRGARDANALMQDVPVQSPPAVNAAYPDKAALGTVPPLILVNLPRLPDGLEYRFMGRDLILRDRSANLVVDFVEGAVPVVRR